MRRNYLQRGIGEERDPNARLVNGAQGRTRIYNPLIGSQRPYLLGHKAASCIPHHLYKVLSIKRP